MNGTPWTMREDSVIRKRYLRGWSVAKIADKLNRSESSVYQRAARLGLSSPKKYMASDWRKTMRTMHAQGYTDAEIARAIGCGRRHACAMRKKLGLPSNAFSERRIEAVRQRTRAQCRDAGVKSLAEVRVLAFRRMAKECGWPEDLRPRAVHILNALWERGPLTRPEIVDAIGMTWRGTRASLKSNDPEGSYLANLMARGLVVSLGRLAKGVGRGRSRVLYSLPLGIERGQVNQGGECNA